MKACVILFALAAAAYAESDPWYYGYGYGLGYGYPYYGYAVAGPCKNDAGVAVPCALGRKKREAEAEPWWGYGYGYGLAHPYTLGYGCHNTYGAPVPCAGRKKREAEAKPWLGYGYPYAYGYAAPVVGAAVAVKPCTNVNGEKVDCALGHKDVATAHIVPALIGRKKREADPVYFRNVEAEVTEHEGKYNVPVASYAHTYPYGFPVATYSTAEVPYKYNTVQYKHAPVENPSDPTNPELVHTSKLGICLNVYGLQVPC